MKFFRRLVYTTQKIAFCFDLWCPLSCKFVVKALASLEVCSLCYTVSRIQVYPNPQGTMGVVGIVLMISPTRPKAFLMTEVTADH